MTSQRRQRRQKERHRKNTGPNTKENEHSVPLNNQTLRATEITANSRGKHEAKRTSNSEDTKRKIASR